MPGKRFLRNCRSVTAAAMVAVLASIAGFAAGQQSRAEAPTAPRLTPLLSSGVTVIGEPIAYPASSPSRVTAAILTLASGQETGWHTHGAPTFGYILEGEVTVDYGTMGERVYRAGDALLEAVGHPHNGRNSGTGPMRILAVFMGADGVANSVPQPAQGK